MTCPLHPWELSAALASTSFNHAHLNGLQHRNTGRRRFRARGRLRAPVSAPRKRPSAAAEAGERQQLRLPRDLGPVHCFVLVFTCRIPRCAAANEGQPETKSMDTPPCRPSGAGGVKDVLVCDGATFRAGSGRKPKPHHRATSGDDWDKSGAHCLHKSMGNGQRGGQHRRRGRFRHWVVDLEATPAKITWQQPVHRPNRFSPSFTLAGQSSSDWARFSTLSCHSSCSGVASAFIWPGGPASLLH